CGRIAQITRAFDNEQGMHILWAGASHGGLWKSIYNSTGNLDHWVTITDNFPGSHVLGSFAVRKNHSKDIVIGTGALGWSNGNGIYYTTEGGSTWYASTMPAIPARVSRIVADYGERADSTLFAATSAGIWISYDFGQNWTSMFDGHEATDVVQDR